MIEEKERKNRNNKNIKNYIDSLKDLLSKYEKWFEKKIGRNRKPNKKNK